MNYPYANGVLSAIDGKILDKINYAKLIKTGKVDFVKTLNDLGYGITDKTLEETIAYELNDAKKNIDQLSPEKEYTNLFFFANDALNIKAMYKKKIFDSPIDVYTDNGTICKKSLEEAIYNNNFTLVSLEHKNLLVGIEEMIKKIDNPRLISAIIDNFIFDYTFKKLKSASGRTLKKYFRAYIDATNVISFVRVRALKWRFLNFKEMFLNNGSIDIEIFEKIFEGNNDLLSKSFGYYYDGIFNKYLREYFDKKNLNFLEKSVDRMLIEIMKPHKFDSFKIGPMVYYYLKKSAEAKNIRAIYANENLDISELIEY